MKHLIQLLILALTIPLFLFSCERQERAVKSEESRVQSPESRVKGIESGVSGKDIQKVIFARGKNGVQLYTVDITGRNERRIADDNTKYNELFYTLTPDKKKIVFGREIDFKWHIFAVDINGGKPVQLTNSHGMDQFFALTPDHRIVFTRIVRTKENKNTSDIFSVSIDGKELKALADSPDSEYPVAVTKDGWVIYKRLHNEKTPYLYSVTTDGEKGDCYLQPRCWLSFIQ